MVVVVVVSVVPVVVVVTVVAVVLLVVVTSSGCVGGCRCGCSGCCGGLGLVLVIDCVVVSVVCFRFLLSTIVVIVVIVHVLQSFITNSHTTCYWHSCSLSCCEILGSINMSIHIISCRSIAIAGHKVERNSRALAQNACCPGLSKHQNGRRGQRRTNRAKRMDGLSLQG